MVCRKVTLARGEIAWVEQCQCGQMHVHVGPFTLRFQAGAIESIHATLGQALDALRSSRPGPAPFRATAAGGDA